VWDSLGVFFSFWVQSCFLLFFIFPSLEGRWWCPPCPAARLLPAPVPTSSASRSIDLWDLCNSFPLSNKHVLRFPGNSLVSNYALRVHTGLLPKPPTLTPLHSDGSRSSLVAAASLTSFTMAGSYHKASGQWQAGQIVQLSDYIPAQVSFRGEHLLQ
jgi:hypothetical protein